MSDKERRRISARRFQGTTDAVLPLTIFHAFDREGIRQCESLEEARHEIGISANERELPELRIFDARGMRYVGALNWLEADIKEFRALSPNPTASDRMAFEFAQRSLEKSPTLEELQHVREQMRTADKGSKMPVARSLFPY